MLCVCAVEKTGVGAANLMLLGRMVLDMQANNVKRLPMLLLHRAPAVSAITTMVRWS